MARLESQSKLLYYPTPVSIAETLATWFAAPKRTRIADPCCGTGEALIHFSRGFNAERIGIELSYSRAQAAEKVLDKVLPTSFYTAAWSVQSVGLIFNNPPYDWSQWSEVVNGHSRSIRHEVLFIERAREKIVVGGHHILIVPRCILGDPHYLGNGQEARVARHLLGWYEDVQVFRFPDGEYERFKQVVILACKKRARYAQPTKEACENIMHLADESAEIPVLPEGDGRYVIPVAGGQYVFKHTPREPKDEVRAMRRCNPTATPEYGRATYIRPIGQAFNPIESIKVGHVTLLISGNDVGGVKLTGEDGQAMLVKGTSKKIVERSIVTNINDKGDEHDDVTTVEKYIPVWTVTKPGGSIETLTDVNQIARLAEMYARELADAVQVRNTPLYGNNPTAAEWSATARIGVNMPALPGRKERGLFVRQRHWAVALQRAMRARKHAIANLGMGTGKTVITIGALNVLNQFPAIVVVPAHMPAEWVKTALLGSDSDSPIKPMWITRPTREAQEVSTPAVKEIPGAILDFSKLLSPLFHPQYQPGWITEWNANTTKWAALQKAITEIGGEVLETTRWHDEKNDEVRRWRKVKIKCDALQATQIVSVVSRSLIVRVDKQTYRPEIQFSEAGLTITYFDADDYTLFDFEQDWKAGELGKKAIAILSIETARYDSGDSLDFRLPQTHFNVEEPETGEQVRSSARICPHCGKPVRPGWRFCKNRVNDQKLGDPILDPTGKLVSYKLLPGPEKDENLPACGAPLFQFSRFRRVGGARLIQHKLRGLFKVYVADECFPGDTPIATPLGDVQIKDICVGDSVLTEKDGDVTVRKVIRVIRNRRQASLLKITHSKGELICTPNHKIFLNGKLVKAEELKTGDELTVIEDINDHETMPDMRTDFPGFEPEKIDLPQFLRNSLRSTHARRCWGLPYLRQTVHSGQDQRPETSDLQRIMRIGVKVFEGDGGTKRTPSISQTAAHHPQLCSLWQAVCQHKAEKDSNVLFRFLRNQKSRVTKQRMATEPGMARKSFQAHEDIQPNGRSCKSGKSHCQNAGKNFFGNPRRKRAINAPTNCPGNCTELGCGSPNHVRQSEVAGIGSRHWQSGSKNCYRSRWKLTPHSQAEKQGPNEGRNAESDRLASGQILELGSRQRLGNVRVIRVESVQCEDAYVYNLEVEDTHRYFAKGVLVSNCHKMKSLDTDAGVADQRFLSSTKYSLGLSGTLFGGSASSIFPILYRRVPSVRAQFAFEDVTRWVDVYGVWEKKWKENKASLTGLGASTGIKRWAYRSRELPGISPSVIRYLLPLCVFGQVTDLGYELPPFSDEVESISMTDEMSKQYEKGKTSILSAAMRLLKEDHDPGGLSAWFNFCRFRANSLFRREVVSYTGKGGGGFAFEFEPVIPSNGYLPKEERLAEIVAENARQGRKTLIFAEQTGLRDIRSRMKRAIESLGYIGRPLNLEILSANDMAPAKRMGWIKANAPGIDALIVNPKLVETGLTLTMFSAIVFYEVTPSLYVLWQSMRRVWRLGQSRDVTTRFLAYAGTVEVDILNRMGKKMRYASMLYGDSAASVLESSDGDEDIKDEIIRAALSGRLTEETEQVKHLFLTGNEKVVQVSADISGSLVASTPTLPVAPDWNEWAKLKGLSIAKMSRRKNKDAELLVGQLSLKL